MDEILVRYCHFIAIIVLAGTLVAQHMLLVGQVNPVQLKKIVRIDRVYGISAVVVLVAGLLLWFKVGKPAEFYSGNWLFHIKVSLFVIMGVLSIFPTIFIIKASRSKEASITVPKSIINLIRAELSCLVLIPLFAVIMAKGHGL